VRELRKLHEKGARLITISCDGSKLYYHLFLDGKILTREKTARNVKSVCGIFPGAELYEREIMEKFGVKFRDHPRPVKLFT
jgi:NADH:ubiquinone oxidoreductase subunit C